MSEALSKRMLTPFGFPFAGEAVVETPTAAGDAADAMGYPVVAKLNGESIAHKTERGLVRLKLANREAVEQAATQLLAMATPEDGAVQLLIAKMIDGSRELIVGMVQDPSFGKTAMLGLGGIFAEVIQDVVFAPMPIDLKSAHRMIEGLKHQSLLDYDLHSYTFEQIGQVCPHGLIAFAFSLFVLRFLVVSLAEEPHQIQTQRVHCS